VFAVHDALTSFMFQISSLRAGIDGFSSEGIVASRDSLAFHRSFIISVGTNGAGLASGNIQSSFSVIEGSSRAGVVGVTSERIVTSGDGGTVSRSSSVAEGSVTTVFAVHDGFTSFMVQISSLRAGIVNLTIVISMVTSRDDLAFSSTNLAREVTRSTALAVKDAFSSRSA